MEAHAALFTALLTIISCNREESTTYRTYLLTRGEWKLSSISFSDPQMTPLSTTSLGAVIRFGPSNTFEVLNSGFIYDLPGNGSWRFSLDESTLMLGEVSFEVVGLNPPA